MKRFDFEYTYAIQHPYNLFDGAIVRKQSSEEKPTKNSESTIKWYKVKIRHDARIFEQIDESEVPNVFENTVGDYILNIRTGYVSILLDDNRVSDPINCNTAFYKELLAPLRRVLIND